MLKNSSVPVSITKMLLSFTSEVSQNASKSVALVRYPGEVVKFGIKLRSQQSGLKRLVTRLYLLSKDGKIKALAKALRIWDLEADKGEQTG